MFSKILIANRGEIACRIIKTCRRLGIATVAVYSEADAGALHVEMADEAVAIGPAPAAQSYLDQAKIIAACKQTGAEAVHPGFGFLAENAGFARALEAEGIVFIGPTPDAIAAMGDKIESKRLAQKAGVTTVPGYVGEVADAEAAVRIAGEIGYPVMIKASAGGGGKGMRIAHGADEVAEGFRAATSEARSSFGDERVFIERYVEQPRHIEIQVLGDAHGNVLYLLERECSIQRRHQKVIEEAPSPFLDEATRAAMGAEAVALAKAVDYRSAGTVEFIVDPQRNFYFLEMNTRLQVEHPVTEEILGIDLVEAMIRVALGEPLPWTQADIKPKGWAIEARVYAEDPVRGFLPSTGRLVRFRPPAETDGVRVDTGVVEGSEISMFYDPMIAKLVTVGRDRAEAIQRMRGALDRFAIGGIAHNVPFLAAVAASPRFAEGRLSTAFIAEEFADGFSGDARAAAERGILVPVAAVVQRRAAEHAATLSGQMRHRPASESWVVLLDGATIPVSVRPAGDGWSVEGDLGAGEPARHVVTTDWRPGQPAFEGRIDGRPVAVQVTPAGLAWRLAHGGADTRVRVLPPHAAALAALMPEKAPPDTSKLLLSPMPGLLVSVAVEAGAAVEEGQALAVVEAMKMENTLRAQRRGTVKAVAAKPGDSLAADQVILEFE